jgi:transposase
MRPNGLPLELEHRRQLVVHRIIDDGYKIDEISKFFGIDASSIRRWLRTYEHEGEKGLIAKQASGRPPKLTIFQEKIVSRWICEKATSFEFNTELWTAPRLTQLIKREFGISFNSHYLVDWLRERHFTPQKPQKIPMKRDPVAIAHWLQHEWPRIKQKAHRKGAYLALIDESGLFLAPILRRSWSPRGHPPELKLNAVSRTGKVSVAAAICLTPKRDKVGLYFKTLINDYFDSFSMAAFLEAMVRSFKKPVIVIWDGGRNHTGGPIRDLIEAFPKKLILEKLPPYAPVINPVEFVWSWLKFGKLSNFNPSDVWDLDRRVEKELSSIASDQNLLRGLFHRSDLPLPRALVSR